MNSRIILCLVLSLTIICPDIIWAQSVLDDVRQDNLRESIEEIKSTSEEIRRIKKSIIDKKKKEEKKRGLRRQDPQGSEDRINQKTKKYHR